MCYVELAEKKEGGEEGGWRLRCFFGPPPAPPLRWPLPARQSRSSWGPAAFDALGVVTPLSPLQSAAWILGSLESVPSEPSVASQHCAGPQQGGRRGWPRSWRQPKGGQRAGSAGRGRGATGTDCEARGQPPGGGNRTPGGGSERR